MSSTEPAERVIAPHAVAFDGFRWHARAFCFNDMIFKDFVLSRIVESNLAEASDIDANKDRDWAETITLFIAPHPGLSDNQRRIIELDYGMIEGTAELEVRKSLLYYNLKRLGLDTDPNLRQAQDQHIVLVNADEVCRALGRKAPIR